MNKHDQVASSPANDSIFGAERTFARSFRIAQIALFCLMQLLCIQTVRADPDDVLTLEAEIQRSFDDNLFRIPDAIDPSTLGAPGHSRSDTITASNVGFMLDKPIGLQKLHIEALETYYDYQNYKFLNGSTVNYLASWQLAVTRALNGKLSTQRQQAPANFAYYQTYSLHDIITQDTTDLNLDWAPTGTWHLTTDLADRKYIDSSNNKQIASYDYRFFEIGLHYGFASGGSIGMSNDHSTGTFPDQVLDEQNQLDTGFKQNESKVALIWPVTADSEINAQLGHVNRQYDHFSSRNYSGQTANISFNYGALNTLSAAGQLPSGYKVIPLNYGFLLAYNRTYNPYTNADESYFVNDKETVQALWMPTPKINVKLRIDANQVNYYGRLPATVVSPQRKDTDNLVSLELDWNPYRTTKVAFTLAREKRSSTAQVLSPGCVAGCNYTGNVVGLSLNYAY